MDKNTQQATIASKVNKMVESLIKELELGSLSDIEQNSIKDQVFSELTEVLVQASKVLLDFSNETNIAIQRRIVSEFKKVLGVHVDRWGITDLKQLVQLNEQKWDEFGTVMGGIAKSLAQDARHRSYFADVLEDDTQDAIEERIEEEIERANFILKTDISKIANNFTDYLEHTNQVVDSFTVKNFELREMLNSALYKLTEVRLSFRQMDIIGSNSFEEKMLRRDIEVGAKIVAKRNGISSNTTDIIRDAKGY